MKGVVFMEFDIKGRIRFFAEQLRYSVAGLVDNDDLLKINQELGTEGYSKLYNIVNNGDKITEQGGFHTAQCVRYSRMVSVSYTQGKRSAMVDSSTS